LPELTLQLRRALQESCSGHLLRRAPQRSSSGVLLGELLRRAPQERFSGVLLRRAPQESSSVELLRRVSQESWSGHFLRRTESCSATTDQITTVITAVKTDIASRVLCRDNFVHELLVVICISYFICYVLPHFHKL
jgi:hypothetical protein